ncbi:hypothetical protein BRCH_01372c [Candidatus Burkholderia brachyanthoides]|nr:hypothetical protein BRCH_01372c [Candidatus Burkholderia brachyanthoides]
MNLTRIQRDIDPIDPSPYATHNVDAAIAHLERVLSAEGANSLFGQTHWRTRVRQVGATRGLHRDQRMRLDRLMQRLSDERVAA